jgi:hypothetical protein
MGEDDRYRLSFNGYELKKTSNAELRKVSRAGNPTSNIQRLTLNQKAKEERKSFAGRLRLGDVIF